MLVLHTQELRAFTVLVRILQYAKVYVTILFSLYGNIFFHQSATNVLEMFQFQRCYMLLQHCQSQDGSQYAWFVERAMQ